MSKGYKAVILPDVHINHNGYDKVYEPVKKFIKDFKPEKIILLGDFADCASLSGWDLSKTRKMEGRRHAKEMANIELELEYLSEYTDEIVWMAGNHEYRVERYLDTHSELEGMIEYQNCIDLDKYNCKWVPYNQFHKEGKLTMLHGRYANKYHANKHSRKISGNLVYCHTHVPQRWCSVKENAVPHSVWCLGCLCKKNPDYLKGADGAWLHGFGILYVAKNGEFNLYPVDIINKRFYWSNKTYK